MWKVHEKKLQEKIKNKNRDLYNFKKYYLINSDWLKEYKEYFLYDQIMKKLDEKYYNYSYKRIKCELDKIIKNEIGQIILNNDSKIPNKIRDYSKFKSLTKPIKLTKNRYDNKNNEQESIEEEEVINTYIEVPINFDLINEDIFELLMKEEFFYNKIEQNKDQIFSEILLGNNQIIIKNKLNENNNNENQFLNSYIIYINNNNKEQNRQSKNDEDNYKYRIKYILDYYDNLMFYDNFFNTFNSKNNINLDKINYEQNIYDDKQNVLGKFYNLGIINEDELKNYFVFFDNNKKEETLKSHKIDKFNFEIIKNNKSLLNKNNFMDNKKEINFLNNKNNFKKHNNKEMNNDNKNENMEIINEDNYIIENKYNKLEIQSNISLNYKPYSINKYKNISNKKSTEVINNESKDKFGKIKRELKLIEPYLKELVKKVINNQEKKNLNLKLLIPTEIISKIENQEIERIVLINEKYLKDIKSYIKYDLINNYLNLNEKEKNDILENNLEEFIYIIKLLKQEENSPPEFSLIQSYNEIKNDTIDVNKYFLLYNEKFQDIYEKAKDIFIYFFKYYSELYIFLEKEKKIFQLLPDKKFEENNLYILKEYKMNKIELLKNIDLEMDKNKYINDVDIDKFLNRNIIEYYLINNNWIKEKINDEDKFKKNKRNSYNYQLKKENINPKITQTYFDYMKYPVEFGFIDKESNEPIIKDLSIMDKEIILENLLVSKIFFVNWQNNIPDIQKRDYPNKIYIGILDNTNNIIYFYNLNKRKYYFEFEFLLQFNDEEIINKEIENYIMKKGIGKYLNDIRVDFSKINESFDLINDDLKNVGMFINFCKKNKIDIWYPNNMKNLQYIEYSYFFIGVLLCLVNLESFQILFDRDELINFIDEDSIFTKYLFYIVEDLLWISNDKDKNNNLYMNFINEIKKSSDSKDIFRDIKQLIELILLKLHNEHKFDENKQRIKNIETKLEEKYENEEEMISNFYSINDSGIQDLFFFDLVSESKFLDENKFKYYVTCTMEFDIDQIKKKFINIYNILDCMNENSYSNSSESIKIRKFIIIPKHLIIIIKRKENNDCQFNFNESFQIDIKKYIEKKDKDENINITEYELVSIIKDYLTTICKSTKDNLWYIYEGKKESNYNKVFDFKEMSFMPYLLIYKIKDKNN